MNNFTCQRCGSDFVRKQGDVNRGRTKFCSRLCSDKYKRESAETYAETVKRTGRKQCHQCGRTYATSNFPPSTTSSTGFNSYCRPCTREKMKLTDLKRADRRKLWSRARYLMRTYGLTENDYNKLLKQQNGGCVICASTARLNIDHCHTSGKIRGILCDRCNKGLGMFKDNPVLLVNAAKYLG